MYAETLGNNKMKEVLGSISNMLVKIGIMELRNTNLRNANLNDARNLTQVIQQSIHEIEAAHHNYRAEVCVAIQFLKETVIEILTNINN